MTDECVKLNMQTTSASLAFSEKNAMEVRSLSSELLLGNEALFECDREILRLKNVMKPSATQYSTEAVMAGDIVVKNRIKLVLFEMDSVWMTSQIHDVQQERPIFSDLCLQQQLKPQPEQRLQPQPKQRPHLQTLQRLQSLHSQPRQRLQLQPGHEQQLCLQHSHKPPLLSHRHPVKPRTLHKNGNSESCRLPWKRISVPSLTTVSVTSGLWLLWPLLGTLLLTVAMNSVGAAPYGYDNGAHAEGDLVVVGREKEVGRGATSGGSKQRREDPTMYLQRYGYLPGSDAETGALRTEEELQRAVREFQHYAGLQPTGELDHETRHLMNSPRCGVADVLPSHGHHTPHSESMARRTKHHHHHYGHNQTDEQKIRRKYRRSDVYARRPAEYALAPSKWQKKWLTFRFLNFTPDLRVEQIRDALVRAFYVWSDVTELTFHEQQTGHADIYIQFSSGYHHDGYPFDGPGRVLAHAFFPGDEKGGDMHFDEDETWTEGSHDGVNLFAVAVHELGHALGLAHSTVPDSLMFPWHRGYDPDFKLHDDDIIAIQYLYGQKNPSVTASRANQPARPPTVAPPTRTTTTTSTIRTTLHEASVPVSEDDPPDVCAASFDAISSIRGDVFAFTGKWFWRLTKDGVMGGSPVLISQFWFGFPESVRKIDAVFERTVDGKIVFFVGRRYWEFNGNQIQPDFPTQGRPITDLGLPADIDGVDAAFVWGYNRRTYIIKDEMYWKLTESLDGIEYSYPRDMSMWGGVPLPVDSAFTHSDQHTYFFHGTDYYQFNNARMEVRSGYPRHVGEHWLKCSRATTQEAQHFTPLPDPQDSSTTSRQPVITVFVQTVFVILLFRFR